MYSVNLEWKEFSVSLLPIEAYFIATYPDYRGNSSDTALTLWFSEELTDENKTAIQAYWDGILVDSTEATSYVSAQQVTDRIAELKTGLIAKSWDTMDSVERKLVLQLSVSNAELGF
jgi:hypothetical protein